MHTDMFFVLHYTVSISCWTQDKPADATLDFDGYWEIDVDIWKNKGTFEVHQFLTGGLQNDAILVDNCAVVHLQGHRESDIVTAESPNEFIKSLASACYIFFKTFN